MSYIIILCQSFSEQDNWTFGGRQQPYNFASLVGRTVTVGFTGNNWIDPISGSWNISTTFSLTTRNDSGRINSTPRAVTAPVIRLLEGCNHTLTMAVSDPDGDTVHCRWAQGVECADACSNIHFPGAILHSNTCVIEYEANRGARYWAASLMIEDFTPESSTPLSSVALQFLVLVIRNPGGSCLKKPVFIPPTIRDSVCVAIPPGETFTSQLVANSSSSDVSINEIQTFPPPGTRVGEVTQIPDTNSFYVNVTWTPTRGQQNQTHMFCFSAVGSDSQTSEQNCIDLLPGYFPPAPLSFPNRQLVHPSNNTTWRVRFDTDIKRSSFVSNIKFHQYVTEEVVYSIDASQSQLVAVEHPDVLTFTPMFSFAEKTRYYITFDRQIVQGLERCGPGNEPEIDKNFWTFETLDVTPPSITFLVSPNVSTSNVSISWESNENVTWACVLEQGSVGSPVNCSGAYWRGYDLREGLYMLQIRATDEAGNVATVSRPFRIDLTSPNAVILQKPTLISNERTPTLTFSCNESPCSYECHFISTMEEGNSSPCNNGRFTTPLLQANTNYTFRVRATDQVGNQGESVSYMWETDFEAPHISGIQNTSVLCINNTLPAHTGQAQAVDNVSETILLTYRDTRIGCSISRTWRATDMANNTALLVQNIDLEFTPTVSLLSDVSLPCDSAAASLQVTNNTALAPSPCGLPVELTNEDSEQRCPGTFSRNWTVHSCGRNVAVSQRVHLYDLCPPYACGRNESSPHGTCIFGGCQCNQPWFGENCDTIIYQPVAELVNDSALLEGQDYMTTVAVAQGTPPLTWTLVSGPRELLINQYTGRVTWRGAQAGSHLIIVLIENQVGRTQVEWSLQVMPVYSARVSSVSSTLFPYAQPVVFNGYVEYSENIALGIVLVHIDIVTNEVTRTAQTYTNSSGNFSVTFFPFSIEYGIYTAGARHPTSLRSQPQVQWRILGMRAVPRTPILNGEAVSTFERTFYNATFIHNDGPGPLTGITTLLIPSTRDVSVEIILRGLPSNGTLAPGQRLPMDIGVAASRPLSGSFSVVVETREGTRLQVIVSLRIAPILPSLAVSPSSLNARVARGSYRIFEFNITNVGRATADNVQSILPNTHFISFVSFGNIQQSVSEDNLRLQSGESALLSMLVHIPEMHQLGEITASAVITSNQVFASLPIALTVSSDSLMNLTVVVEDEYTYFASGQPLVNNAIVTISTI